ncbi:MAG: cupin domain-containing protein [Phycisphaerales bacterium]|nr:cupin domain-containing protein [Phycisphaerales bacterium]
MIRPRALADISLTPTSHDPSILKRVLVSASDSVGSLMQLAISTLEPGQVVEPHVHRDLWEIFMVRSGRVLIKIDRTDHLMATDDWVVVPPGVQHAVAAHGEVAAQMLVVGVAGDPPDTGAIGA